METSEKSRELVIYDGASSAGKKLTQCNSDLTDEERKTRLNKLKKQNSRQKRCRRRRREDSQFVAPVQR